MKKITLLTLILFTSNYNAQSFEGKITYSNNYQSKVAKLKSEQLNALMGTKQDYYIKGGNYKSVFNGIFTKMQVYKVSENKNYTLTGKNDTLYWEDYSVNKELPLKYELLKKQDTIMGLICDALIIETNKSKTVVYFSSKYTVNSSLFKNHHFGNWYYIISKTGALPLKTITETDQFILTSTATEIKAQKLEDNFFEIVDKMKVARAYW